jgi:RNA-directed DNA polymerase
MSCMRSQGGYQYSMLRAVPIPKEHGKFRIICIPTVRDRIVQRSVNAYLAKGDRCKLANEVSYGFIPNRSVEKAVKRAAELRRDNKWVYKTDVTTFFDSIDRDLLRGSILRHVKDRSLHPILIAASQCEIEEPNNSTAKKIEAAGIHKGRGVRQGMPLSPFFANLLLKNFDSAVQLAGIRMVRYADDLICVSASEAQCHAIHAVVGQALAKEGLTVPPIGSDSKSRIYGPDDPADFLGLQLRPQSGNYVLEVPAAQTGKIRQRIVSIADLGSPKNKGITLPSFFRRLDGLIAGYTGAYEFAHNASHFEAALSSARRDAVAQLFKRTLNLDVELLSHEQRRFLGIIET